MTADLSQTALTAASLLFLRFINTGDRMLDNALTTFASALLSVMITGFGSAAVVNWFTYYILERPKTPYAADPSRYKHPANLSEWNCSWRDEVPGRQTTKGPIPMGSFDVKTLKVLIPCNGYSMHCYCVWEGTPVYVRMNDDDDEGVFSSTSRNILTRVVDYHHRTYVQEVK